MAIKVDFKKDFDHLSQAFIVDTLRDMGFPIELVNLIMDCICSATIRVLQNSGHTEDFFPLGILGKETLSPFISLYLYVVFKKT